MSISKSIDNFSDYFYKNVPGSSEETAEEQEEEEEVVNPTDKLKVGCSAISAHLILSMAAFAGAAVDVNGGGQNRKIIQETFYSSQQPQLISADSETEDEEEDFPTHNLTISERAGGFVRRLFRTVNNVYMQEPVPTEPIDHEDFYYDARKFKNTASDDKNNDADLAPTTTTTTTSTT